MFRALTRAVVMLALLLLAAAPAYAQVCDKTVAITVSTNGTTQLVALTADKTIVVCGFAVTAGSGITSVTGTDPAANVEASETVPTNARWRVLAVRLTLVTDATAANREVAVVLDDGTNIYARAPSRFTHAASLTRDYSYAPDLRIGTVAQDTTQTAPMPDVWMPAGHRLRTITTNRQAGDNYAAPQLLVQEATSFKLVTGTGTNCGTGTADASGTFEALPFGMVQAAGGPRLLQGALSSALCITNNRPTTLHGVLSYAVV